MLGQHACRLIVEAPGEIAICVAIDDGYVPHFATCVASIAASRGSEAVRFFVLRGPKLSAESVRRLEGFVCELGMDLEAIVLPEDVAASMPPTLTYSPIVWYRMLIPELLPDLDRVLVLDADLLVLQSLASLYTTELGSHLLAAVGTSPRLVGSGDPERSLALGLDPHSPYLNTGVMLMNLEAMRAEMVGPRALALGHERYRDLEFPEQDALNVVAAGRWKLLHPRWNALSHLWLSPRVDDPTYSSLVHQAARMSPAIVHFEGLSTVKPWFHRSIHPMRFLYRDFRNVTPWPLDRLEGGSLTGVVMRLLPIGLQRAISRAKTRCITWLRNPR